MRPKRTKAATMRKKDPKPPKPVDDCERGVHVARPRRGNVIIGIECDSCGGVPMVQVDPKKFICPRCEQVVVIGATR